MPDFPLTTKREFLKPDPVRLDRVTWIGLDEGELVQIDLG